MTRIPRRISRLPLVLTLVLCCVAALALSAAPSRPAGTRAPALHKPPTPPAPVTPAKATQGKSPVKPIWLADTDTDCEIACFDGFYQCCTYGACEQCSCQLALCRAYCGDPYYGC